MASSTLEAIVTEWPAGTRRSWISVRTSRSSSTRRMFTDHLFACPGAIAVPPPGAAESSGNPRKPVRNPPFRLKRATPLARPVDRSLDDLPHSRRGWRNVAFRPSGGATPPGWLLGRGRAPPGGWPRGSVAGPPGPGRRVPGSRDSTTADPPARTRPGTAPHPPQGNGIARSRPRRGSVRDPLLAAGSGVPLPNGAPAVGRGGASRPDAAAVRLGGPDRHLASDAVHPRRRPSDGSESGGRHPDPGRKRNGEGPAGPGDPLRVGAGRPALRHRDVHGAPGHVAGKRSLRPREGRLHGRQGAKARDLRDRRRRDDLPE